MSVLKQIVVLANSIKHAPSVCIAGREILANSKSYTIGSWIRPVSSHGEGELSQAETVLTNKRQPKVFDFVSISLTGPSGDVLQPENWRIATPGQWIGLTSQFKRPPMDMLSEEPDDLWLEPGSSPDRASKSFMQKYPPIQSLYLVKVESLRCRFEWNEWDSQSRLRRRVIFRYRGVEYDISVTDPVFLDRHRERIPRVGAGPIEFPVSTADPIYVCVSLAPEFNGFHYKVAATIFEPC